MRIQSLKALAVVAVSLVILSGQARPVLAKYDVWPSTSIVPAEPRPQPPTYSNVLFAPLYHIFGGYSAKIYAFNPTTSTINLQLSFDPVTGATTPAPVTFSVDARAALPTHHQPYRNCRSWSIRVSRHP